MSPHIKNCRTCAHCLPHELPTLDKCARNGGNYCGSVKDHDYLAAMDGLQLPKLCEWEPVPAAPAKPPRRGLLQVIRDLFYNPNAK